MTVVASLEKPDALTDVLDMLKPRGRVFCCSELSSPWAMACRRTDVSVSTSSSAAALGSEWKTPGR
jgi:Cupin